jgi:hypothetical protein
MIDNCLRGKRMLLWMAQVSNYHASEHCSGTFRRDTHSFVCFQTANRFNDTGNKERTKENKKIK